MVGLTSSVARAAPGDGEVGDASETARAAGQLHIVTSALAIVVLAEPLDREREPIELGSPPIAVELPAGRYRITATGPGYRPWAGELEVRGGQVHELQVEPELIEVARVELRAANEAAEGASVLLDGEPLCELPCSRELAPGRHQLDIDKRRHKGLRFALDLQQADSLIVDVALEPATSRAPAIVTGAVALTSLTVAIGFTVSAVNTRNSLAADLDGFVQYDADDRRFDNGRRDAVVATSLYGVTAAVGLMTLYYLLRQTGPSSRADMQRRSLAGGFGRRWALVPAWAPNGAGVVGAVRF